MSEQPPLGATVHAGVKPRRDRDGGTRFQGRARWTHPQTGRRTEICATFGTRAEAEAWVELQRSTARTGIDAGQTLADYCAGLGDRWARAIDSTSTVDPYSAGLRLRVLPELGHLPVSMISAGLIDRAIDRWQETYGASTVKNTVAGLVLVLDEAVRDGLIARNPAKDRARRRTAGRGPAQLRDAANPRDLALPDVETLDRLVRSVVAASGHQCWGDMVTLLATTGLRISEAAGLRVGDVDLAAGLLHVERQTYPGKGGLTTKATKGRRRRTVPIIAPLRPTLERLTEGRLADARLLSGPRGGVITTATLRDATGWDELVRSLGLSGLVRHGLRHTALTWMADAGTDLYLLQRIAGHQDPAVTARYLHPDTEALRVAGDRFSAWWGQNGGTPSAAPTLATVVRIDEKRAGPAIADPTLRGRADRI